ncbi:MAG: sensor histidine kinase [Bacillota bacterium]
MAKLDELVEELRWRAGKEFSERLVQLLARGRAAAVAVDGLLGDAEVRRKLTEAVRREPRRFVELAVALPRTLLELGLVSEIMARVPLGELEATAQGLLARGDGERARWLAGALERGEALGRAAVVRAEAALLAGEAAAAGRHLGEAIANGDAETGTLVRVAGLLARRAGLRQVEPVLEQLLNRVGREGAELLADLAWQAIADEGIGGLERLLERVGAAASGIGWEELFLARTAEAIKNNLAQLQELLDWCAEPASSLRGLASECLAEGRPMPPLAQALAQEAAEGHRRAVAVIQYLQCLLPAESDLFEVYPIMLEVVAVAEDWARGTGVSVERELRRDGDQAYLDRALTRISLANMAAALLGQASRGATLTVGSRIERDEIVCYLRLSPAPGREAGRYFWLARQALGNMARNFARRVIEESGREGLSIGLAFSGVAEEGAKPGAAAGAIWGKAHQRMTQELAGAVGVANHALHDVKNAYSSIGNWAEKLLAPEASPTGIYRRISANLERLCTGLDEARGYLQLTGISEFIYGRVSEVVREAVRDASAAAVASQTQLCLKAPDDDPKLKLDRQHLYSAVLNLIKNGLEADPGGRVSVAVQNDPPNARVTITVSDQGQGLEKAGTRVPGRTGLGLAAVRRAVELHGGDFQLEDGPEGTRAVISLSSDEAERRLAREFPGWGQLGDEERRALKAAVGLAAQGGADETVAFLIFRVVESELKRAHPKLWERYRLLSSALQLLNLEGAETRREIWRRLVAGGLSPEIVERRGLVRKAQGICEGVAADRLTRELKGATELALVIGLFFPDGRQELVRGLVGLDEADDLIGAGLGVLRLLRQD